MKTSELIEKLEKIRSERGDLRVVSLWPDGIEDARFHYLETVEVLEIGDEYPWNMGSVGDDAHELRRAVRENLDKGEKLPVVDLHRFGPGRKRKG